MLTDDISVPRGKFYEPVVAWVRHHPWKTTAITLGLVLFEQVATLPFGEVSALASRKPGTTALMEERAAELRGDGKKLRMIQQWVPLKAISPDLVNAVIVAEDGTFWSHHGFDWFELKESVQRDIEEGRAARGASTITQQLVKNLFLSTSKNPLRKMKEWVLTWWMEQ
ncbi:MAG TPA: biosynthetic peptidoglycan transglycosylase, partial [Bacteroidota bacterium]|nr:biosynthetic peptidoglycan transglycosylase [Bacteroidota bacterium]